MPVPPAPQPSSVQDEEDCEVQSLGDFEAATDRIQSIRPVTPRHISPSPLTELESEISSPSTSRRVSSPIVSRRQQKRPIMEVVLTSKRLTKDKSLNPSSAQSAAIGPVSERYYMLYRENLINSHIDELSGRRRQSS